MIYGYIFGGLMITPTGIGSGFVQSIPTCGHYFDGFHRCLGLHRQFADPFTVCHQLYNETRILPYTLNVFRVWPYNLIWFPDFSEWLSRLSEDRRDAITTIYVQNSPDYRERQVLDIVDRLAGLKLLVLQFAPPDNSQIVEYAAQRGLNWVVDNQVISSEVMVRNCKRTIPLSSPGHEQA